MAHAKHKYLGFQFQFPSGQLCKLTGCCLKGHISTLCLQKRLSQLQNHIFCSKMSHFWSKKKKPLQKCTLLTVSCLGPIPKAVSMQWRSWFVGQSDATCLQIDVYTLVSNSTTNRTKPSLHSCLEDLIDQRSCCFFLNCFLRFIFLYQAQRFSCSNSSRLYILFLLGKRLNTMGSFTQKPSCFHNKTLPPIVLVGKLRGKPIVSLVMFKCINLSL